MNNNDKHITQKRYHHQFTNINIIRTEEKKVLDNCKLYIH